MGFTLKMQLQVLPRMHQTSFANTTDADELDQSFDVDLHCLHFLLLKHIVV